MLRCLTQIGCALRLGSVSGADQALRCFAAFLARAAPAVTSIAQVTRRHIGAVGLTEAQARERLGGKVSTAIRQIPQSPRGRIHKAGNDGFIKLVVDSERGILAGATSAGPDGGEVLSMLTLAVHAAVPVQRLREMIYPYPTFHGAVPEAIGRLT